MSRAGVVVTGMGVVSPLGPDLKTTWDAALNGRSGVATIDHFDPEKLPVRIAGQAVAPHPEDTMHPREKRRGDHHIFYAVAAARQAWRDAGLDQQPPHPQRAGISLGSGIGGIRFVEDGALLMNEKSARRLSPFLLPGSLINMPAGTISIELDLQGPSLAVATACATGVHSIGLGVGMIERGDADIIVAGGTEASITPLAMSAFAQSKALSFNNDKPQAASRPWDKDRDGFVMGEGAAILILESMESARARGARTDIRVSGFGMASDAHHITAPEPSGRGAEACMRRALQDAEIQPAEVDYINAHATSTVIGDRAEAQAICRLFGEKTVPVNATKSLTGHLLGAAGALESIISILSIRTGLVHPTLNLDCEEEGLGLDIVTGDAREGKIRHALCNSFGFGGTNACLVFSATG